MHRLLLILLFLSVSQTIFAQAPDPDFTDKMALQENQTFFQKSSFRESEGYLNYNLVYQRMEWQINPAVRFIKGKITSYVKSKTEGLSDIEFDLQADMIVDSVMQNQEKINFSHNEDKLHIQLNKNLQQNQVDSLSIFYRGEPVTTGFGSFAQKEHNATPIIWTLSEPYGAKEWWPCKQSLADKIDSVDVIVKTPEPFRTASNGILVSESVTGNTRIMHWKHRFPIATYLVAIALTNYADYSDYLVMEDSSKIEILNYVYPENLSNAKASTPVTTQIMKLYNDTIGKYPFAREKYGHAQFGWGGGMEHQTMSFMYNFGFELIAHELAHQWFGDYITLASWHDVWLNEGFATYMTGIAYENLLDGVWWPLWKKQTIGKITSEPGGSVYVEDTTSVSRMFSSRLSYSKGAYLLHMLRWVLGDKNFFKGLRDYFNDPRIGNGFAQNNNFIRHMEVAGDTTLAGFFSDWYYGEGFPIYSLEYSRMENNQYKLVLSQTPSHNSVAFFEMPVPVRMYNSGKTDSIDLRLNNTANNQEFTVDPGFEVSELKIDPDYWLISKTAEVLKTPLIKTSGEISIYPNPFRDKISVYIPSGQQLLSVELFDSAGNKIKIFSKNKTDFNCDDLPEGWYVISIKTSKMHYLKKIVKDLLKP